MNSALVLLVQVRRRAVSVVMDYKRLLCLNVCLCVCACVAEKMI